MKTSYRNKRKLFALFLMILGLVCINQVLYSWVYQDIQRNRKEKAFQKEMKVLSQEDKEKTLEEAKSYEKTIDSEGGSIVDPFEMEEYNGKAPLNQEEGFAYMVIPKLELSETVFLGAGQKHLMKGVAQVEGTSLPIGGMGRRSVIAGHRGGIRRGEMFLHLDKLESGDSIYLYTLDQRLVYKVGDMEIILPSENEKLLPKKGQDMITLLTCHPFPVNNKRLLVNCYREEIQDSLSKEIDSIEKDRKSAPVDSEIKKLKTITYTLTGILTTLMILLILLFIREWRKPKRKR